MDSVPIVWAWRYTPHSSAAEDGLSNFFDIYKKLELFYNPFSCKDFINMKSFLRGRVLQTVYGSDEPEGSQGCLGAPSIIWPPSFRVGWNDFIPIWQCSLSIWMGDVKSSLSEMTSLGQTWILPKKIILHFRKTIFHKISAFRKQY